MMRNEEDERGRWMREDREDAERERKEFWKREEEYRIRAMEMGARDLRGERVFDDPYADFVRYKPHFEPPRASSKSTHTLYRDLPEVVEIIRGNMRVSDLHRMTLVNKKESTESEAISQERIIQSVAEHSEGHDLIDRREEFFLDVTVLVWIQLIETTNPDAPKLRHDFEYLYLDGVAWFSFGRGRPSSPRLFYWEGFCGKAKGSTWKQWKYYPFIKRIMRQISLQIIFPDVGRIGIDESFGDREYSAKRV